ncbi:MAG: UDP-2,3-diacylglucosamine diphosphatase LpxI [Planctomycetota bacterium]|nr:MAG: UDP-2,3-diacylglucosamine diphosphatase LpxI [Planctomycetota bacterium]
MQPLKSSPHYDPITLYPRRPAPPPTAVGLIAGGGRLPVLVAQGLRADGHIVHGLGLLGQYEDELPALCTTFRDVGLLRVGSWGKILRRMGVHHAIMVGRVDKANLMHDPFRLIRNIPDLRTLHAWFTHLRHDRRSSALLAAIAEELERCGVSLIDSTAPIPDHLATAGVMTRTQPNSMQRSDVEFVWPLLAELLRLDIGQSLAIRERDVIAVEAVEGTDRMIERVSAVCRAKGWTLCKGRQGRARPAVGRADGGHSDNREPRGPRRGLPGGRRGRRDHDRSRRDAGSGRRTGHRGDGRARRPAEPHGVRTPNRAST